MLRRKVTEKLVEWKNRGDGKALLVTGARQIGKSYAIREFAKAEYASYVEINLFESKDARDALASARNLVDFINRIVLYSETELIEGNCLVFIDEVQELPDVMTMAKFLVEDGRYSYAFSGSMLGVEFKEARSYPVGYVHEITMRPMDFEEFCWAIGVSRETLGRIAESFEERRPVDEFVHESMLRNYRTYLVSGGMPEVVQSLIDSGGSLANVRSLQTELNAQYRHDISKYSGSRNLHVKQVFDGIPYQLEGEQHRFLVNSVDPAARYERYERDFVWLVNAGVALKVNLATEPAVELKGSEKDSLFKLYQSDTGMLMARYSQAFARDVYLDHRKTNVGAVYENAVAQDLVAAGFTPYYFNQPGIGEVDFLVQTSAGKVLPVEVKSGRYPRRHAALDALLGTDAYRIREGVVLSRLNVEWDAGKRVLYLPHYMVSCLGSWAPESADDGFALLTVSL